MDLLGSLPTAKGVGTYASLFNTVNDICHPKKARKQFNVDVHTQVSPQLALSHGLHMTALDVSSNPMAAMFGGGPTKSEPAGGARGYSIAARWKQRSSQGLQTDVVATASTAGHGHAAWQQQWTPQFVTRAALLCNDWATAGMNQAAHFLFRGSDFAATARVASWLQTPITAVSYNQRVLPAGPLSKLQLGGELIVMPTLLRPIMSTPQLKQQINPMQWSLGGQFERLCSSGAQERWLGYLHRDRDGSMKVGTGLVSNVTAHTALVAKAEVNMTTRSAEVLGGYKVTFPRTRSVMQASMDSAGKAKVEFERRLLSNARFKASAFVVQPPAIVPGQGPAPASDNTRLALSLTIGNPPAPAPLVLSPGMLRNNIAFHR